MFCQQIRCQRGQLLALFEPMTPQHMFESCSELPRYSATTLSCLLQKLKSGKMISLKPVQYYIPELFVGGGAPPPPPPSLGETPPERREWGKNFFVKRKDLLSHSSGLRCKEINFLQSDKKYGDYFISK